MALILNNSSVCYLDCTEWIFINSRVPSFKKIHPPLYDPQAQENLYWLLDQSHTVKNNNILLSCEKQQYHGGND